MDSCRKWLPDKLRHIGREQTMHKYMRKGQKLIINNKLLTLLLIVVLVVVVVVVVTAAAVAAAWKRKLIGV